MVRYLLITVSQYNLGSLHSCSKTKIKVFFRQLAIQNNFLAIHSSYRHCASIFQGKTSLINIKMSKKHIQEATTAGKCLTTDRRGKTYKPCQARENVQSVPSVGKQLSGAKRGKNPASTRGPAPRVRKHARNYIRAIVFDMAN